MGYENGCDNRIRLRKQVQLKAEVGGESDACDEGSRKRTERLLLVEAHLKMESSQRTE